MAILRKFLYMTNKEINMLKQDLIETKKLMFYNANREAIDPFAQSIFASNTFNENRTYDSLYTFATEDMRSYYKSFKHPQSFLSIGASGDQVANAINSGATIIDVYDSNNLCRYSVALKLAAIKALTKKELIVFYDTFDPYLFSKVATQLDELSFNYWGNIYMMFNEKASLVIKNALFTYKRLDKSLIYLANPYLDDKIYQSMPKKINKAKINFISSDLYNLPKKLGTKKYDAMTFSNIYEYLNYGQSVSLAKAQKYHDFIIKEMLPHLNDDGCMMISYLYAFNLAIKNDFDAMYKAHPDKLVPSGAMTLDQYPYYIAGLTTQNYSYSKLLDTFEDDPITLVPTSHIEFGQSKDMSHDLALCLKK